VYPPSAPSHARADAWIRAVSPSLLPGLPLLDRYSGVVRRAITEAPVTRAIFAATRAPDAARPSTVALLAAVRHAAAALSST